MVKIISYMCVCVYWEWKHKQSNLSLIWPLKRMFETEKRRRRDFRPHPILKSSSYPTSQESRTGRQETDGPPLHPPQPPLVRLKSSPLAGVPAIFCSAKSENLLLPSTREAFLGNKRRMHKTEITIILCSDNKGERCTQH